MAKDIHRAAIAAGVLLALGGMASQASAAQGFYAEADVGTTSVDLKKAELDEWIEVPTSASSLDKSDIGYGLAVGYRFSPYFGVEAGYLDLGKSSYKLEDEEAALDLDLRSRGPALSLVGTWPINDIWSLEGRAGAYFGKSKLSASITDGVDSLQMSLDSESHTSLLLGAGIVASFGERWSARLGYTWIDTAAKVRDEEIDADWKGSGSRISLGLRYSF